MISTHPRRYRNSRQNAGVNSPPSTRACSAVVLHRLRPTTTLHNIFGVRASIHTLTCYAVLRGIRTRHEHAQHFTCTDWYRSLGLALAAFVRYAFTSSPKLACGEAYSVRLLPGQLLLASAVSVTGFQTGCSTVRYHLAAPQHLPSAPADAPDTLGQGAAVGSTRTAVPVCAQRVAGDVDVDNRGTCAGTPYALAARAACRAQTTLRILKDKQSAEGVARAAYASGFSLPAGCKTHPELSGP